MDLREPGNPIDDRTPALNLPLVNILNANEDDVERLRAALLLLDTLVSDRVTSEDFASALAGIRDSAPAVLDTFREFADALGNDPNYAATIATALAGKATIADVAALQAAIAAITFASLLGKPTTRDGYGITDVAKQLPPELKTAAFTAVNGGVYLLDSSAGAFTVQMPLAPNPGDTVVFIDVGYALEANPITLARNGQKWRRLPEDYVLNVSGVRRIALFTNANNGWGV